MSLRKVRKKKIVNLVSDQEETAKETLFQISYFQEENPHDESQVLIPNRCDQNYPIVKLKKTEGNKQQVYKKKSKSLSSRHNETLAGQEYSGYMHTIGQNRKIAFNTLEENHTIFNAIESNKVFVGNKICFNSARPQLQVNNTVLVQKKRVETMPVIKQRSDQQLSKKDYSTINRFNIKLQNPLVSKLKKDKDKWKPSGLLKNERDSYLKLKSKLKRDLFIGLQERFSRKCQFFL